mmetsp:Transcript_10715/g.17603  ORF Transcript_10715/g.17603 Transcript_10715/m.17603 type:complete len:297 (+) Transcript_10715:3-893(+)
MIVIGLRNAKMIEIEIAIRRSAKMIEILIDGKAKKNQISAKMTESLIGEKMTGTIASEAIVEIRASVAIVVTDAAIETAIVIETAIAMIETAIVTVDVVMTEIAVDMTGGMTEIGEMTAIVVVTIGGILAGLMIEVAEVDGTTIETGAVVDQEASAKAQREVGAQADQDLEVGVECNLRVTIASQTRGQSLRHNHRCQRQVKVPHLNRLRPLFGESRNGMKLLHQAQLKWACYHLRHSLPLHQQHHLEWLDCLDNYPLRIQICLNGLEIPHHLLGQLRLSLSSDRINASSKFLSIW